MNNPAQSPGGVFMRSPGGVRGGIVSGADAFTHVYDICLDSSGNIIVGGRHYRFVGSTPEYASVVRLDSEGDLDATFDSWGSVYGYTYAVAVDSNDKVIEGTSTGHIARHNTDGSIDATFSTGTGFDYAVLCLAVDASDKIYVGGSFNSYNGTPAGGIIRLNTDGSIDTGFSTGTGFSITFGRFFVQTLCIDAIGKILVSGAFNAYDGTSVRRIVRLNTDGTLDTAFSLSPSIPGIPLEYKIKTNSSGYIFLTQNHSVVPWAIPNIKLLSKSGSIISTLISLESRIFHYGVDSSDKVVFTHGYTPNCYIYRINAGGSIDATFNNGLRFNDDSSVVFVDGSDRVLVGGSFSLWDSTTVDHIVRLDTNGDLDTTFRDGV